MMNPSSLSISKLLEEEDIAKSGAPEVSVGKSGGGGGMMSGGTNVISNVADTAMKVYMAEQKRKEEEKKYKQKLALLGGQNMGDAASSGAQSELAMNNMMGSAFMKSLLGR